ncbi:PX domain-containing protein YPT35 [Lasiodiplodia hormozganensis]|uniref:Endosomal/vacuolar adapter protein YPT35 n=1 Tax=Lasiodiplodia hormozganensis TaxID=869390 RepID=A0AA39YYG5_9PEZI|nr:PX domain-containing protein YPT35 [Lasiodiplodia hormozganensis]
MESTGSETPSHPTQNGHVATRHGGDASTARDHQIVPPYWPGLRRRESGGSEASLASDRPAPIRLEDHTAEGSDQNRALWAKSVTIDDHVIVSGNVPGMGDYVVWNCTVQTLDGGPMKIRKRYSEFDELRRRLAQTFPHAESAMPQLPPKSVISRFRPRFLERRREGLAYFLNCVLLNPEFSSSPVLKEFLFS